MGPYALTLRAESVGYTGAPGGTSALIPIYSEQGTLLLLLIFRFIHVKWGTGTSHSAESPLVS